VVNEEVKKSSSIADRIKNMTSGEPQNEDTFNNSQNKYKNY
jgi:hypothetical protein